MRKIIGKWLQILGTKLAGQKIIHPMPERIQQGELNFAKCQCGHAMHDHQPDGNGFICLVCYSLMRHRPAESEPLEAQILID